ncbi:hypothetical protein [Lacipirellula parvula]|uniref:Uncharacterized protein n=1 Tax=Lacipirellula parvula TaxID=2650471 RepID=A0A5K7X6G4_9BACT|nr:hypothetical protein [Lacipirellula parvula]BBO31412.1 hypothetical protein PLANPX_1024 [Lacipirellula parvula]
MNIPPHGSEIAYVAIFAIVAIIGLIGTVRDYGLRVWRWPWGVWFRRSPPS